MHDKEYFNALAQNIITWAVILGLGLILFTIVGLPIVLAILVDWRWVMVYIGYAALLVLLTLYLSRNAGENTKDGEGK